MYKRLRDDTFGTTINDYSNNNSSSIVHLLLRSDDRMSGSTITNADFQLNPSVITIGLLEMGWFSFYNTIYLVDETNNVMSFVPTAAFAPFDVQFTPGNWLAPVGELTLGDFNLDPTSNINDIRYEIFRQASVGCILSITVSPINGHLYFTFAPAAIGVIMGVTDTSEPWSGLVNDGSLAGLNWVSQNRVNLSRPQTLALASSDFTQSQVVTATTTQEQKSVLWFDLIPITASFGSIQVWEPLNPATFSLRNNQMLNRINIQLRNPQTGRFMQGFEETDNWELMLRIRPKS